MKKNYIFLFGLIFMSLTGSALTKVTFRVNMKNETVSANGVHIPGSYQTAAGMAADWDPSDANVEAMDLDGDDIYELTVSVPPGSYDFKYVNNNDWMEGVEDVPLNCQSTSGSDNREVIVGATDIILDIVCFSSCTNCKAARIVTFMLVDSNLKFTNVKFNLQINGNWIEFTGYDNGTNWDKKAGDYIFTGRYFTKHGNYEWMATNNGSSVIQGINPKFKMDSLGKITGDTVYRIPKFGALIGVTFNIDMSKETVDASGVYVSGNFLESLQNPITNWDKDTLKMTPRYPGSQVYTLTLKMYAGNYVWKIWNGKKSPPNDDLPAETYNFTSGGCGEPNGTGGHNRNLLFKGATTAKVLKTYYFNSCNEAASISKIKEIKFGANPNPANLYTSVSFNNCKLVNFITITDLTGRVVLTQNVNSNNVDVNLEELNKGIYLVNAFGKDGTFGVQKLIKN